MIPEIIVNYAKRVLEDRDSWEAQDLKNARESALAALARYRQFKELYTEREQEKQKIRDWLKSISES